LVGYLDDRYIVSIYILTGNPGLGMQLTLNDFDYKDDPPAWLPQEKWEDIIKITGFI
jgi:hypothetical protein